MIWLLAAIGGGNMIFLNLSGNNSKPCKKKLAQWGYSVDHAQAASRLPVQPITNKVGMS